MVLNNSLGVNISHFQVFFTELTSESVNFVLICVYAVLGMVRRSCTFWLDWLVLKFLLNNRMTRMIASYYFLLFPSSIFLHSAMVCTWNTICDKHPILFAVLFSSLVIVYICFYSLLYSCLSRKHWLKHFLSVSCIYLIRSVWCSMNEMK